MATIEWYDSQIMIQSCNVGGGSRVVAVANQSHTTSTTMFLLLLSMYFDILKLFFHNCIYINFYINSIIDHYFYSPLLSQPTELSSNSNIPPIVSTTAPAITASSMNHHHRLRKSSNTSSSNNVNDNK